MRKILSALVLIVASILAQAAELPLEIGEQDVRDYSRALLLGSKHRAWTAHSTLNTGLGLDLGLESSFVLRGDLRERGDGSGVIPKIVPVPRLWASWDMEDFFVSLSYAPGDIFDGIWGAGLGVQWTFYREPSRGYNFSVLVDYTYQDAFGDLEAHTNAVFIQTSKDMIFWQPYAAAGFSVANTSVNPDVLKNGVDKGPYTVPALHWYLGLRLDFLAKLAFQIDFVNVSPSFSILLSNSF